MHIDCLLVWDQRCREPQTIHSQDSSVLMWADFSYLERHEADAVSYPLSIYKDLWPKAVGSSSAFKLDSQHMFSRNPRLISFCTAAIYILIISLPPRCMSDKTYNKSKSTYSSKPHHSFSAPDSELSSGITWGDSRLIFPALTRNLGLMWET